MCNTLTLHDCATIMRDRGFRTSTGRLAKGIESGVYPFGRMINRGPSGRRSFEIFAGDFYRWLDHRTRTEEA